MLLKHNGEAMKAKHIKCLAVLFSAVTVLLVACRKDSFDYGVFIGDDINQQKKYERYDNIVVDPSSFKSKQVEALKADGKNVYDGVNQEDVFTTYDFNKKKYGRQTKKIRIITKDTLSRQKKQDLTSTSSNIEPARNFQKKSTHIASDTGINGTTPTELI